MDNDPPYKYSTEEEAKSANLKRTKQRYQQKRDEIVKQYNENPTIKEKRRLRYLREKQEKEEMQKRLLLYERILLESQKQIVTPNFILEIID